MPGPGSTTSVLNFANSIPMPQAFGEEPSSYLNDLCKSHSTCLSFLTLPLLTGVSHLMNVSHPTMTRGLCDHTENCVLYGILVDSLASDESPTFQIVSNALERLELFSKGEGSTILKAGPPVGALLAHLEKHSVTLGFLSEAGEFLASIDPNRSLESVFDRSLYSQLYSSSHFSYALDAGRKVVLKEPRLNLFIQGRADTFIKFALDEVESGGSFLLRFQMCAPEPSHALSSEILSCPPLKQQLSVVFRAVQLIHGLGPNTYTMDSDAKDFYCEKFDYFVGVCEKLDRLDWFISGMSRKSAGQLLRLAACIQAFETAYRVLQIAGIGSQDLTPETDQKLAKAVEASRSELAISLPVLQRAADLLDYFLVQMLIFAGYAQERTFEAILQQVREKNTN